MMMLYGGRINIEEDDSIKDIAAYTHMTTDELLAKVQEIVNEDIQGHIVNERD